MPYFTDIASELYEKSKGKIPNGVTVCQHKENDIEITKVHIQRKGLNRPMGSYVTLDIPHAFASVKHTYASAIAISQELSALLPKEGAILVCGIGNREITADALGTLTAEKVISSKGEQALTRRCIYITIPGVEGARGVSTNQHINAIVKEVKPSAVLCVDSLLTRWHSRLGTSVQLSTAGLAAGTQKEISAATIGVAVVAMGVPTMMQLKHPEQEQLVLTCKNIDVIIKRSAALLSLAINKALYPPLTLEEIEFITS